MKYRTRKLVKPEDLNSEHTLFGGQLLRWLDEECAIYAMCQLGTKQLRTRVMGEAVFEAPAYCGDVIEIGVEVVQFGTTSITLRAEVRNKDTQQVILRMEKVVMVSVDGSGKKTPHGCSNVREG